MQLHRSEDGAEAASWDGLQWERCDWRALPVPRHWRPGGGLHRSGGPGSQRRGENVLAVQPSNDEELSGAFPVFQPSLCSLEQWLFKLVTLALAVFLIWPHFRFFFFCPVFFFPGYKEQQREGSQLYCPLKRIFHRTLCSDGHTSHCFKIKLSTNTEKQIISSCVSGQL